MLGHQLLKQFSGRHETRVTLHRVLDNYLHCGLFSSANSYSGIDVRNFDSVRRIVAAFRPDAIVNATGIVKQRAESAHSIPSIEINSLFPHRVAVMCQEIGARFIHMSTDCVFSGRKGHYMENDTPDAEDLYGRSKLLGEVSDAPCITLRTSIIGRELYRKTGLLEWFLAQSGHEIKGYRRAIFSGFTTLEMARVIDRVLTSPDPAHGLFHVSSTPINKYDLLMMIRKRMKLQIAIEPDDLYACDRSLNSSVFRSTFAYAPPSWEAMIDELALNTG